MKKLLILPIMVAAMASPAYIVSQHPKVVTKEVPIVQTKTVTVTQPQVVPVYHVGDTQSGITLVGIYPYSEQSTRGGNSDTPITVNELFFAVSGVSSDELLAHSVAVTTDGKYVMPYGALYHIDACGSSACVPFIAGSYQSFRYRNLEWQL